MKKIEEDLPILKQPYELTEYQQKLLDRYKEELDHRLAQNVSFSIYTENFMAYPQRVGQYITFELEAGNWKRIARISEMELNSQYGQAFYYFLRQLVDDTMADLLKRGAATY